VVAELVSVLILAVFVGVDLDGVIREVDELILRVSQLKFVAACSDVPLLVPVALDLAVQPRDQHVAADVELPPVVKERPVDVFLDDESLFMVVAPRYLACHPFPNPLVITVNGNAIASV
jgi:hypothetical protein